MVNCRIYSVRELPPTTMREKLEEYEKEWEIDGLRLQRFVGKTHIGRSGRGYFSFSWDTSESTEFHGEKMTFGRTHECGVWFESELGEPLFYVFSRSGDQDLAREEIVRMLFDDPNDVRRLTLTTEHLRAIITEDSNADHYMWWQDISDDCDGALRGNLRGGYRERFDHDGRPYFDMFDSNYLQAVVKISTRKSSITAAVPEENLIQYVKEVVLPIVRA